jgi:hypothetical protein
MAHKRATTEDPHSWTDGVIEVGMNTTTARELDRRAYDDWRRTQDEFS